MAATAAQTVRSARSIQARQALRRRFLALVIDLVVLTLAALVVNNVYGVDQVTSGRPPIPGQAGSAFWSASTTIPWGWLALLWLAYYIVSESIYGASLGKLLTGICVVRSDGNPVGHGAVVSRNVARFVDVLPGLYLLGGVAVLGSPNSQRFGDWAAKTMVVGREHVSPGDTPCPRLGTNRIVLSALAAVLLFTVAFAYFGRPPLVLQGSFNQGTLIGPPWSSYQLGSPSWGFGSVTYPVSGTARAQQCTGTITLEWGGRGWSEKSGQVLCTP